MTQRKKRLDKLKEHRARAVDERLSDLSKVRALEQAASQRAEREASSLERARQQREQAFSGATDVSRLSDATDWLLACAARKDAALQELTRAQRAVARAQQEVLAARNELRKIELVAERLALEERKREERVEQKMTDEFAALRFREPKKSGEDER
ncbi:MAG TPA: flagellar export protein FliJ [Polyangiaceae bacterium]|nr:flagellar export protein FliJ [Polyangiaceae bacterium]